MIYHESLLIILFIILCKHFAFGGDPIFTIQEGKIMQLYKSNIPMWVENNLQCAKFVKKPINLNNFLITGENDWKFTSSYDGPVTQRIEDRRLEDLPQLHLNANDVFQFNNSLQCKWIYIKALGDISFTQYASIQLLKSKNLTFFSLCNNVSDFKSSFLRTYQDGATILLPQYYYYYSTTLTHSPRNRLPIPLNTECLALFATVCHCCILKIQIKYGKNTKTLKINQPEWKEYKILLSNSKSQKITYRFIKNVTNINCTNPYFALDGFRTCVNSEYRFIQRDPSLKSSKLLLNKPINYFSNCSNNGFGVDCLLCEDISPENNCTSMKICQEDVCFGSKGYYGDLCNIKIDNSSNPITEVLDLQNSSYSTILPTTTTLISVDTNITATVNANCIEPDVKEIDFVVSEKSVSIVDNSTTLHCKNIMFNIVDNKNNTVCTIKNEEKCENLRPGSSYKIYLVSNSKFNHRFAIKNFYIAFLFFFFGVIILIMLGFLIKTYNSFGYRENFFCSFLLMRKANTISLHVQQNEDYHHYEEIRDKEPLYSIPIQSKPERIYAEVISDEATLQHQENDYEEVLYHGYSNLTHK